MTEENDSVFQAVIWAGVRDALRVVDPRIDEASITPGASLVDELGLDSIKFVGLAVALEESLGIAEFPMQEWADAEAPRDGRRFTVRSLVELCRRCLEEAA